MLTEVLIVGIFFGAIAIFCLFWMLANLLRVVKAEGLSGDYINRMRQTKEILLKPALLFFAIAVASALYFGLRVSGLE